MTGAKFYPQHKDKCYCRQNSSCTHFVGSNDFVKTKSVKYRHPTKIPDFVQQQTSNFEQITCSCCKNPLNYSQQRSNYELNQRPMYERTENDFTSDGTTPRSMGNLTSRCSSVDLLLKSYNDEKMNKISEFRSNNSNDCISISNRLALDRRKREMQRAKQSHVCSHRFTLNERLRPVPVHKDEYGSSTCVDCSKSLMDLNPLKVGKRIVTTSNKYAVENVSDAGQEPILILEVQMDKAEIGSRKLKMFATPPLHKKVSLQGFKRVQPNNSLALQFQNTT